MVFNGGGVSDSPVRWCGTEGGNPVRAGGAVWSTTACPDTWCGPGSGSGSPPNTTNAIWYPSGVDVTLQTGDRWFYMPGVALHPLADLVQFYHSSVGMNGHLEIDFAISRTGEVDPLHAAAYAGFGNWIRSCYGDASRVASGFLTPGLTSFVLPLGASPVTVDRVRMREDQTKGQLIFSYTVEAQVGGAWQAFSSGVSIGASRIDLAAAVSATALRFSVTAGWGTPTGLELSAFGPAPCALGEFEDATQ